MRHIRKIVILISLFALALVGCKKEEPDVPLENEYSIYYLDSTGMELLEYKYLSETGAKGEKLVAELFEQMKTLPKGSDYKSAISENMVLQDFKVENELLSVNFTDDYYNAAVSDEIMFRAAYVKTMTQIEGVKYISFYVNEQPLLDAMGKVVGVMHASDFVDAIDSGAYNTWVELSIYYANSSGDRLCPEKITVGYGKNASIERVIVEQLIKGPSDESHIRTVPASLALMSVTTRDGICYLNFDSSLQDIITGVSANITIYSIVNSLCELPYVNKVSISINNNSKVMFWDTIDLSVLFERNLDLIE